MKKLIKQFVLAVLTFGLVLIFLQPYFDINPLDHQNYLYGYTAVALLLICGLRLMKHFIWPWVVGLAANALIFLYLMQPLGRSFGWSWLMRYGSRLFLTARSYFTTGGVEMPQLLSVSLVMAMVILLGLLICVFNRYLLAVLIVLAYLMSVAIFNGNNLVGEFSWLILIAAALALLKTYSLQRQFVVIGAGVLVILAAAALGLPKLTAVTSKFTDATSGLRNKLNNAGFYESISSYANQNARTGLSDDDDTLGGPVYDNNTPVAEVIETDSHYLRVQVKTHYTGRGWSMSLFNLSAMQRSQVVDGRLRIPDEDQTAGVAKKTQQLTVRNVGASPYIGLPYGTLALSRVSPGKLNQMRFAQNTRRLYSARGIFTGAQMTVAANTVTVEQLEAMARPDTVAMRKTDLQLPKELPSRVTKLAKQITKGKKGYYAKVAAVEDYLSVNPNLTYSKVDTPVTPKGRDYVDYFLFTSKVGYCDNFSSSMVILLRSIGIPARWAKGFNGGSYVQTMKGGQSLYRITNANAHSWPEVYFGKYGWLPFEPTPGFTNPSEAQSSQAADSGQTPRRAAASSSSAKSASASSRSSASSKRRTAAPAAAKRTTKQQRPTVSLTGLWIFLLVVVIAALALFFPRWRALGAYLLSWQVTPENFAQRYRLLLRCLTRVKKRSQDMSLTRYAQLVDQKLELAGTFGALTAAYQAQVFGGQQIQVDSAQMRLVANALLHSKFARWRLPFKR